MPGFSDAIGEFLWNCVMDWGGADEEIGSCEGLGAYSLFRGGFDADAIDRHNEIVLSEELQREEGHRERLLKADDIRTLILGSGFVLKQTDAGFVDAEVYWSGADLEAEWGRIMAMYTVETCDLCGGESEEFGAGNPVTHTDECPTRMEEEDAA